MYQALQVFESQDGVFEKRIVMLDTETLPQDDLLIKVKYSSVNYKDMLSANGNRGVTRSYPHTPGIDAVGVVQRSSSELFREGDQVLVTGYDLGMNTAGGFGEYISVPASWVLRLPESLSPEMAMIYGTAGLTAALSVDKLLCNGLKPNSRVLVTGATGGVGTVAVAILAKLGMHVIAATGKSEATDMLLMLGAQEVVGRDVLDACAKPMLKELWDAVCDTVGGEVLGTAIKQLKHGGSVTTCGLVAGTAFNATVLPFILRGVNLLGIDSVEIPLSKKNEMWNLIGTAWNVPALVSATTTVALPGLPEVLDRMKQGTVCGRYIVKHA
jgi:alcohol dehydrogenase